LLAAPLSVLENGVGAMKVLTPAALTPRGGSLRLLRFAFPPFRSQPRGPSDGRFVRRCSAIGCSRLRHYLAGSPRIHAESDSCSYRLAVRLRLLPTLPRGRCSRLRLHSYDTLWRGLTPRRQSVLTDAQGGRARARPDEGVENNAPLGANPHPAGCRPPPSPGGRKGGALRPTLPLYEKSRDSDLCEYGSVHRR
jgi:hypothetical protein